MTKFIVATPSLPPPTPPPHATRGAMPTVALVEKRANRLHEVIKALGINPAKLARLDRGAAYQQAREKCLYCSFADECVAWLSNGHTLNRDAADFCPNRDCFDRCR